MKRTVLVIDTNYLCHRAKHSTGHLVYEASPTGVIFGLLHEIMRLWNEFKPETAAFCFDSRTSKRQEIYPQYKQARRERHKQATKEELKFEADFHRQIVKLRRQYLPMMGFTNVFVQKGYEADDIMAAICDKLPYSRTGVIISGDHDMFQCLRENVLIYDPMRNTRTTLPMFFDKYNIYPNMWWAVKALSGCTSDGVKGIEGVGEKTAIKYMRGILPHTNMTYKAIKAKYKEIMQQNIKLVRLPMEGTRTPKIGPDKLSKQGWREVCIKLGFKSMIGKSPWKGDYNA